MTGIRKGKLVMNARDFKTAVIRCSFGIFIILQSAIAQSAEPKTVVDYFLAVPEKYMGYPREEREVLIKGQGITLDIKNGYLAYKASDNPEEFEFALFKQTDGTYLVAINFDADPDFDSKSKLHLLTYNNGRWSEVTKEVLTVPFNGQYIYTLPRVGTTIKVTTIKGKRVHDLIWANDKFQIKK
jgi:hypothetical protein